MNVILKRDEQINLIETFFRLFQLIGFVIFRTVHENVMLIDNGNVLNHVLMIVIVEVDIVHVYVIMIVECHVSNEVN